MVGSFQFVRSDFWKMWQVPCAFPLGGCRYFFALHLLIILNDLTFAFAGGRGLNVELDPCLSNPCLNRGECIQLRFGRYKCECTGTNFYGEKCQKGKRKHRVIVNVEFQAEKMN